MVRSGDERVKIMRNTSAVHTQIASVRPACRMSVADRVAEASSEHRNYWLRYAVRETIGLLPSESAKVLSDFMAGCSICEMARLAGKRLETFVRFRWNPAVRLFKKVWGHS